MTILLLYFHNETRITHYFRKGKPRTCYIAKHHKKTEIKKYTLKKVYFGRAMLSFT